MICLEIHKKYRIQAGMELQLMEYGALFIWSRRLRMQSRQPAQAEELLKDRKREE